MTTADRKREVVAPAPTGPTSSRRPVRREGAEHYLFLTLISFAGTVIATRSFLELTGYPRIGGGELHIAHALFGGIFLFAASLLPLVLSGRTVYRATAVLSGIGIGLFIDEVGKLITSQNNYFYPAAAPIIYATFLLAAFVWVRARRRADADPRSQLLTALQLLEESVEGDLQEEERLVLRTRLESAASHATDAEQRRLASELLEFVNSKDLEVVPDPPQHFRSLRRWWIQRRHQWLGGRGLRALLVVALFVSGAQAILALGAAIIQVTGIDPTGSTKLFSLAMVHLVLEGMAGILLIAGASLLLMPQRRRLGARLSTDGLLVALTLADLASFYLRQFAAIETALFHGILLAGVIGYRNTLSAEAAWSDAASLPADDSAPPSNAAAPPSKSAPTPVTEGSRDLPG
jgi:hypothetical protein